MKTIQRHLTVRTKKNQANKHETQDVVFGAFSAASNKSSSNFGNGPKIPNADSHYSSNEVESKGKIERNKNFHKGQRTMPKYFQMSGGNGTSYFPNIQIEGHKDSKDLDHPSQNQSLKDFNDFRNSSFDHNEHNSSSEDRPDGN